MSQDFQVGKAIEVVTEAYYWEKDAEQLDHIADDGLIHDEGEVEQLSLEEIYERRRILAGLVKASKELLNRVDAHIAERLGPAGYARFGNDYLSTAAKTKLVCSDPEGLVEYLGSEWHHAFNLNYPRTTALREVAKKRQDDPDHAVQTYYEEVDTGERKLAIRPIEKAPRRALEMASGEVGGGADDFPVSEDDGSGSPAG